MSNGYPMGAVVGSRAVMEPAQRMFISSSYWSDNIGLGAALATIRELKRRDSEARFREIGEGIRKAMNEVIDASGLSGTCAGVFAHPYIQLDLPDEALRPKVNTLYVQEMARRGVHGSTHFYLNLAHTEQEIRQTAEAVAETLAVIRTGLEAGDLDSLLACEIKKEPFRRLVR
jgi:glutamate-1-semialdehyde 2,1-aminomutase